MTGVCNPLTVSVPGGGWQSWCKPCGWESPVTHQYSLAVAWRCRHEAERRAAVPDEEEERYR